jgi:hypothetical protein
MHPHSVLMLRFFLQAPTQAATTTFNHDSDIVSPNPSERLLTFAHQGTS